MNFLLDTCAIIWLSAESDKLSMDTLSELTKPKNRVHISPISAGELASAQHNKVIAFEGHWKTWLNDQIEINGWNVIPIDMAVIQEAYALPESYHDDLADKIIIATARLHELTLVTTDDKLLDYPHVKSTY